MPAKTRTIVKKIQSKPIANKRRRSNPRGSKSSIVGNILYGCAGVVGTVAVSKIVPVEKKWMVSGGVAAVLALLGKKFIGPPATSMAVGAGIATMMNLISQSESFAGLSGSFQDYIGCPGMGVNQLLPYPPQYSGVYPQGTSDYWLDPTRSGVTHKRFDFIDV